MRPTRPETPRLLAGALLALGLVLARPAAAEDDRHVQAQALTKEGTALYGRGDYAGALARFREAYAVLPSPKILYNLGQAALQLHDDAAAANAFSLFVDSTLDAADIADKRAFARQQIPVLIQHLGRLRIEATPPEAELRVDGEKIPTANFYVKPGTHTVEARAEKFQPRSVTVEVLGAQDLPVKLRLDPVVETPPVATDVPKPTGQLPAAGAPKPGPDLALTATPPAHDRTGGYVLTGVGAAALVASGVFGLMASNKNAKLDALVHGKPTTAQPADAASLRSAVRTDAWVSTGALAAGVISAGVGAYLLFHGDEPAVRPAADANANPAVSLRF